MNLILYEQRCKCNEEFSITKKRKKQIRSEGKALQYLNSNELELFSKTFRIPYQKNFSPKAKFVLNSLEKKYIYYGIDDILYLFKSTSNERNKLLGILYSPIISLQNNFSVNFFDIWIHEIYIDEILKKNRFIKTNNQILKDSNLITIKLFYRTRVPVIKQNSLW